MAYTAGGYALSLGGPPVAASGAFEGHGRFLARLGERRVRAAVVVADERRHVFFEGRDYPFACVSATALAGEHDEVGAGLTAPMPGKVVARAGGGRAQAWRRGRRCWCWRP